MIATKGQNLESKLMGYSAKGKHSLLLMVNKELMIRRPIRENKCLKMTQPQFETGSIS